MSNLINLLRRAGKATARGLGEYFLGTETHKYYRERRNFSREFLTEQGALKKELKFFNKDQFFNIILGRVIPNIASCIGVGYAAFNHDYETAAQFILPAEAYRFLMIHAFYKTKEVNKEAEDFLKEGNILEEELRELTKTDEEGEEWKRGTDETAE